MNYNIQDFCCLCLSTSNEKCSNDSSKYADNLTPLDKIKTVFLGLSSVMETDDKICMKCSDTVGFIYEFHKTCLRNINIFSSYKKILKDNLPKKQCGLFVDLNNKLKTFKENTLSLEEIKVEPAESPLNNDDTLCDAGFVSESHAIGVTEIKEETELNYETHDGESDTLWLNSEIKIEYEGIDLKREWMNDTNETSNIKDFDNTSVQSNKNTVNGKEEKKELIEDPLQEVAEEKSDERQGHFEFIAINHSKSFEEKLNHLKENVESESHNRHIDSKRVPMGKEPFKCDICGDVFNLKGSLKTHMFIHAVKKPHSCDICGKPFRRKHDLKMHMIVHTDDKPYSCDICGKLFNLKVNLKTHMLIHTNEKPHRCEICGKLFTRKYDLKMHMIVHTGEKPHRCDICGKLFRRIDTLNSHKLIHTGEKTHKCHICGKLSRRKEDLKKHFLIHTDEKPHKCDICGKLFKRKVELTRHSSIHTG